MNTSATTPPPADLMALSERSDFHGNTGIYVRAKCDGKWGSHDIAELSGDSLLSWLRADGGCNPRAENTLLTLFNHEQVARPSLSAQAVGDDLEIADILENLRNGDDAYYTPQIVDATIAGLRSGSKSLTGGEWERAYVTGYRAAIGASAAECRRIGEALDGGGNTYVRYQDAIKCAVAVSALRPPTTPPQPADGGGRVAELLAADRAFDLSRAALIEVSNRITAGSRSDDDFRKQASAQHSYDRAADRRIAALAKFQPAGGES